VIVNVIATFVDSPRDVQRPSARESTAGRERFGADSRLNAVDYAQPVSVISTRRLSHFRSGSRSADATLRRPCRRTGAQVYDAVYFRPFNFRAADPDRRSHAVQYISMPTNNWQKLRSEHPGVYEKGVNPAPDPNGWFHARIVVASPRVSVFVEHAKEPSLVIAQLSDRRRGMVGIWVDNFGGDFANLAVTPARG